ncbi:MAG: hypothetical protein ACYDAO_06870 [Thermoplasmataceae archaeon]
MKLVKDNEDSAVSEIIGALLLFAIGTTVLTGFILWYVPANGTTNDQGYQSATQSAFNALDSKMLSSTLQRGDSISQSFPLGVSGVAPFSSSTDSSICYSKNFNAYMNESYNVSYYNQVPIINRTSLAYANASSNNIFNNVYADEQNTYSVNFIASNLPSGTIWYVKLGGNILSSDTGFISFSESQGTYAYQITSDLSGVIISPESGSITVPDASISVNVSFYTSSSYVGVIAEANASVSNICLASQNQINTGVSSGSVNYWLNGTSINGYYRLASQQFSTSTNETISYIVVYLEPITKSRYNAGTYADINITIGTSPWNNSIISNYSMDISSTQMSGGGYQGWYRVNITAIPLHKGNYYLNSWEKTGQSYAYGPNEFFGYAQSSYLSADSGTGNSIYTRALYSDTQSTIASEINATSYQPYKHNQANEFRLSSGSTINYVVLPLCNPNSAENMQFSIGTSLWASNILSKQTISVTGACNFYYVAIPSTSLPGGQNLFLNVFLNSTSIEWGFTGNPTVNISFTQNFYYAGGSLITDNNQPNLYQIGFNSNTPGEYAIGSYAFSINGEESINASGNPYIYEIGYTPKVTKQKFDVTFNAIGLPSNTGWQVIFNQTAKPSGTSNSIVFQVENGTYTYDINASNSYLPQSSTGVVVVKGFNQPVNITFSQPEGTVPYYYDISNGANQNFTISSTKSVYVNYISLYLFNYTTAPLSSSSPNPSNMINISISNFPNKIEIKNQSVSGSGWTQFFFPRTELTSGVHTIYINATNHNANSIGWGFSPTGGFNSYLKKVYPNLLDKSLNIIPVSHLTNYKTGQIIKAMNQTFLYEIGSLNTSTNRTIIINQYTIHYHVIGEIVSSGFTQFTYQAAFVIQDGASLEASKGVTYANVNPLPIQFLNNSSKISVSSSIYNLTILNGIPTSVSGYGSTIISTTLAKRESLNFSVGQSYFFGSIYGKVTNIELSHFNYTIQSSFSKYWAGSFYAQMGKQKGSLPNTFNFTKYFQVKLEGSNLYFSNNGVVSLNSISSLYQSYLVTQV